MLYTQGGSETVSGGRIVAMSLTRQMWFWLLTVVVGAVALWLLREILLPYVAGMALAYLLDPLANRLERLGINRLLATLVIVGLFVLGILLLVIVVAPILGGQLLAFIDKLPDYVTRVQALLTDPSRPWLRKIVGDGFADGGQSAGELVRQGMGWLAAFLRSLWSGGQALISIFSLVVVTPVVAFYLIFDWKRMIRTIDRFVPRPQLEQFRALALEIDDAIAGFGRWPGGVGLVH